MLLVRSATLCFVFSLLRSDSAAVDGRPPFNLPARCLSLNDFRGRMGKGGSGPEVGGFRHTNVLFRLRRVRVYWVGSGCANPLARALELSCRVGCLLAGVLGGVSEEIIFERGVLMVKLRRSWEEAVTSC